MPRPSRLLARLSLAAMLALLPPAAGALAQGGAAPGAGQAPGTGAAQTGPGAARQQRAQMLETRYDDLRPAQKQRLREALAGPGKPPMTSDQAKRQWDEMSVAQRRQVMRRAQTLARQQRAASGGAAATPPAR